MAVSPLRILVTCILLGTLPALVSAEEKTIAGLFRFGDVDKGKLGLWEGKRPVLVYNHGIQLKEGVPENRKRSTYLHPIYGLDGEVLTDDFPKDHYHHRGLYWGWPHVRIGGKEYNLWALSGIRQQFERWLERKTDKEAALLGVANGWYVGDKKVVHEEVRFRIGPATASERTIDVELKLTALDEPVTLWGAAGKSYGGMSLRFGPRQETTIATADGVQKKDFNLAHLPWADLSARFEGRKSASGIALFVDPGHPDYQPTWITRHYGFLGVGWPGVKPQELSPGKPLTLKYRLLIHRDMGDVARIKRAYEDFTKSR